LLSIPSLSSQNIPRTFDSVAAGRLQHWVHYERSNMSRATVVPFLIAKDEEGHFRITTRSTRFNSWGYPIVTSSLQPDTFKTAMAARAHAKLELGAEAGQFASK
jgi:hypothetical protein